MTKKKISEEKIREELKKVLDPELGISIVDLGLVYKTVIKNDKIKIIMTLTTPFCPLGATIAKRVEQRLKNIFPTERVEVEFTFDPPWSPDKMSRQAREKLGL